MATPSDETDSGNSLLNQLQNRLKGGLKPTMTKTTFPDGTSQFSTDQGLTPCKDKVVEPRSYGFVVDEKPDLTIGQVTPWLFLSSQDVPNNSEILNNFEITHILSLLPGFALTEETKEIVKCHLTLEIYDEEVFSLSSNVCKQAFEFIKNVKSDKGKVLVHCNAGISRAPSVVIAYLIQYEGFTFQDAFEAVKTVRPKIKPNDGFLKQLRELSVK